MAPAHGSNPGLQRRKWTERYENVQFDGQRELKVTHKPGAKEAIVTVKVLAPLKRSLVQPP